MTGVLARLKAALARGDRGYAVAPGETVVRCSDLGALLEVVEAAQTLYEIAINGVVCTPPDTWDDPFLGGDGTGQMFDVEALHCDECRSAWRNLVAALAGLDGEDG